MAHPPQLGDVDLVAHPPERRRRSTLLATPGCCCCCCCCLHSVGSLAGAIYGQFRGQRPPTEGLSAEDAAREKAERTEAEKYARRIYWWALLIVAIITSFATVLENRNDNVASSLGISLLVIGGFLPIGQYAASVLTLIYLNVFPPVRKQDALRRLGRMTLYSFIWGLIGAAVIWVLAVSIKW